MQISEKSITVSYKTKINFGGTIAAQFFYSKFYKTKIYGENQFLKLVRTIHMTNMD